MTPAGRFQHLLDEAGLPMLSADSTPEEFSAFLTEARARLVGALPLDIELTKRAIGARFTELGVPDPRSLLAAAFTNGNGKHVESAPKGGRAVELPDPAPWPTSVDGAALLDAITAWLSGYIRFPPQCAPAIALWVATTWFLPELDFAPILAVLSATKRCGKTNLLSMLGHVVRRGYLTSGSGVTTAVVFRLNETHHPTFLIDEAEKLAGRQADRELIGMLNAGYRRGSRVQRCAEVGGDFDVLEFDAFGFRALAAIGTLWDTILDRAIIVRLERKAKDAPVRRFSSRVAEREGAEFAAQLRRWSDDARAELPALLRACPQPDWLNDRACDNWSGLFAIAALAGGAWGQQSLETARALSGGDEERDHAEILVHDIQRIFRERERPEAIASGDLADELNKIETSPWPSYRADKGLVAHSLAKLLRPLGVRPRAARTLNGGGPMIRGYWRSDLESCFRRYPSPAAPEPLQSPEPLQGNADRAVGSSDATLATVEDEREPGKGDAWEAPSAQAVAP